MNNPFFDPHNQSDSIYDNSSSDREDNEVPSEQTTKSLKKIFTILITIGLILGIISSWIIVKLMNKYGLTEKTNQLEQIQKKIGHSKTQKNKELRTQNSASEGLHGPLL